MTTLATIRDQLRPLHEQPQNALGHLLAATIHGLLFLTCVWFWQIGYWPFSVLLWFAIAWMDHAALSRLHESAHRMLFRSALANELVGILIGTLSLTPLSVYRYVHTQHHAHLGRELDPEFRPYNQPDAPRWKRLTYAFLELGFGWIVTPWLYSIRTARAWPMLNHGLRRRLLLEWTGLVAFWWTIILVIAYTNTWTWFLVGHLAPTWIAGTVQTIRKFTEHLGRFGDNIYDMTRTVVYKRPLGRVASLSQLHVELHGTHHRWPRIPFHRLPEATRVVYNVEQDQQGRIYSSHLAAIRDMLPHLADPKVGPQWKTSLTSNGTAKL